MAKNRLLEKRGAANERAADRLIRTFVDLIESGRLADGDVLPPEREIVEEYGVSRTVAREAVQALANRGLIDARPRFRPIVRRPSFETAIQTVGNVVSRLLGQEGGVRNLFETRVLVEAGLVRDAARRASELDLQDFERALEANEAAIANNARFFETDSAFHRLFYEVSGNPVLVATHKAFSEWLSPHWFKMPYEADRNMRNYLSHKAILDAVRLGEADAAEAALRAHLDDAWDQVRDTFR